MRLVLVNDLNDVRREFIPDPHNLKLGIGEKATSIVYYNNACVLSKQLLLDCSMLKELLEMTRHKLKEDVYYKDKKYKLYELYSYDDLMRLHDCCGNYGESLEKIFFNRLYKISPSKDSGDRMTKNKKSIQFKISIIKQNDLKARFNNIKIWQDINYYVFLVADRRCNYNPIIFKLTSKEMAKELVELKAIPTNCTKKANKENKNQPKTIALNCCKDNKVFQQWIKKYYSKKLTKKLLKNGFIA